MLHNKKLEFKGAIKRWDEALPLGNGDIGALLWGESDAFRISLDKGDIWDTTRLFENNPDFSYAQIQKLVHDGNAKRIREIFDAPYGNAAPTKLTAGKIIVHVGEALPVDSTLDFTRAEAKVQFGNIEMKCFVCATDKIGMAEFQTEHITAVLKNPIYGREPNGAFGVVKKKLKRRFLANNSPLQLEYPAPVLQKKQIQLSGGRTAEIQSFCQATANGFSYCTVLGILKTNKKTCLAFTVADSHEGSAYCADAQKRVVLALEKGYAQTVKSHEAWWTAYFAQSAVSLPNKFIENQWYLNNYLLGSCSRTGHYPMPLQGLWTADDEKQLPPWKGDYHADLNMQLSYYSYLKANHVDAGQCFIDYLLRLSEKGRCFAKSFFNAEGICLPAVMDIEGNPLGGWPMYSFSPVNQLWLCNIVARHFNTLGNTAQIQEKAYPYVRECAAFILSLLKEDAQGYLKLPLSSSPEIHDNTIRAWLPPNSNYDQALLISTFTTLKDWAQAFGYAPDFEKWNGILNKLEKLHVNDKGELLLCKTENLEESHRHHSHAHAIHPLRLLDYDCEKDREIIDATVLRIEKLGTKNWVGYSFAWLAELYVIQRRGDKACQTLEKFFQYFCSPNGFHLNGDYTNQGFSNLKYRPFTLEGNFCAADAVQEMLLFAEGNTVEVFRAVPDDWKTVSFENFRGNNGIQVTAHRENGHTRFIKIDATEQDVQLCIRHKFARGFESNLPYENKDTEILVHIPRGESLVLQIAAE